MAKLSSKKGVQDLVNICKEKGIKTVVISPGSRNAPLIVSFTEDHFFTCLSICDERSAAFFALGIAQQIKSPVALVCTSGSAVLNYAPAIAEAFYQNIPLLVITADRPKEWIDQAEGQTIHQENIFSNYIRGSFNLPQEATSDQKLWYNRRMVSEAINKTMDPIPGPVHINLPLEEPLYKFDDTGSKSPTTISSVRTKTILSEGAKIELETIWTSSSKKLILCGLMNPDDKLNKALSEVAKDPSVAILTETTSNLNDNLFNGSIDNILFSIGNDEAEDFQPDLLITLGGPVVSKKIKHFLRRYSPNYHWHLSRDSAHTDTFQSLTHVIDSDPLEMIKTLKEWIPSDDSSYKQRWKKRDIFTRERGHRYISSKATWSDLTAFNHIVKHIPDKSQVQWGNSTPIRYAQLFRFERSLSHFANRGTSGVDGCVSTGCGAAFANHNEIVSIICGDITFLYDSNALWNQNLTNNIRIIVINNSGGGIFRMIEGPDSTSSLEKFFEAKHNISIEYIAQAFGIDYLRSSNANELTASLQDLYSDKRNKPAILEVFTPNEVNPKVIKEYFKYLKIEDGTTSNDESEKMDFHKGLQGYQV
ncbi:MAG: 2-succinyl-5-enolpyruvyl-6-hydroxy-3-cyclohexene-1-carboxylic-acid synthase [Chitinophagales bacterium]|nr:2-succinyl-5-enolpyruvyl-6-hydroxy-3-cyclohexene-1-carboxylic-acid synthase [Chitinophagales bacterium]